MRRPTVGRALLVVGGLTLVGGAIGVGAVGIGGAKPQVANAAATKTASVERRTLVAQKKLSGTLGYDGTLRVVNQVPTSGQVDIDSLHQALISAQMSYNAALRTLDAIRHPTADKIASARARVANAEASLLAARDKATGPSESQVLTAKAQLEQAQVVLDSARQSEAGPSATELAQAKAQLAQAEASVVAAQSAVSGSGSVELLQAQSAVTRAQQTLDVDQQALVSAQRALAECKTGSTSSPSPSSTPVPSPDCSTQELAVSQASARVASDQSDLSIAQAQLDALTSPKAKAQADANLASAEAQVQAAQSALDALTSASTQEAKKAQLDTADAALRSAQKALEDLTSPETLAQNRAQLDAAEAELLSARTALWAIVHPTNASTAEAIDAVSVARAGLEAARAKLEQLRGTITWLPAEGAIVERGQPLYQLDGSQNVVLMYGAQPAWRRMTEGDKGEDVKQLQENLLALGFGSKLRATGTFDAATTAAVKGWQKKLRRPPTGSVELGDVVFTPQPVRVTSRTVTVGDTVSSGAEVLKGTTPTRTVTLSLDADDQSSVKVGDAVDIDLPDGSTTTGTVATISSVAKSGQSESDSATVATTVSLDDPAATGKIDQAPVKVRITTDRRENVLAVPVNALVALLEGGYAVEVDRSGQRGYVRVDVGLFSDGYVEVRGDGIHEGDQVVVPA